MSAKDTGIFTAEGNLAGERAAQFAKERAQQLESLEKQKAALESDGPQLQSFDEKFRTETLKPSFSSNL